MCEKGLVSMEQNVCLVCGKPHDTGALLMQTRGINNPKLERNTVTGWGLCPEHQKLYDEGYIGLVEIDPDKSTVKDGRILPQDAYRTGNVAHIRKEVFGHVFEGVEYMHAGKMLAMIFIGPEAYAQLVSMTQQREGDEECTDTSEAAQDGEAPSQ